MKRIWLGLVAALAMTAPAHAANNVAAGAFVVERPAHLLSLGFEWKITGDDNRNSTRRGQFPQEGRERLAQGHVAADAHGRGIRLPAPCRNMATAFPIIITPYRMVSRAAF